MTHSSVEQEFEHEQADLSEFDAPELSPQDYASHTCGMTANAFASTGLFEVVEEQAAPGQVHLLGRVKQEKERSFVELVVHPVLQAFVEQNIKGFIGKQFMIKNGKLRYGWVVSFSAKDVRQAANHICGAFENLIPRREVMEAPLLGGSTPQSGGLTTGRKGAHVIR
jgi:hypothetical protein